MSEYWYPLSSPTIGEEEIEAATEVLRAKATTCGDKVEEFEEAFCAYVEAPHAVMVNSGSSADLLIAMALRCDGRAKGKVICPAVTWPTHVWSWWTAGSVMRFSDVDGINTTAELMHKVMGEGTSVLSLVHLMGVPLDMDEIACLAIEHNLVVTEDCCEALGATWRNKPVGSFSTAAAWSFFFSHHMTTMEGGMVTTHDGDLADRLRAMRSHGWARHRGDRYSFTDMGFNLRPLEISAAMGLVQLDKLDTFNKIRAENRETFVTALAGHPNVSFPAVPLHASPSWFGLPMFVHTDRDGLAAWLEDNGVETRPILAGHLGRQSAFDGFFFGAKPGADYVHDHGLYVGLHPDSHSGVEQVAAIIGEYQPA